MMKSRQPTRGPREPRQSGTAILIAIFALLLISVVGIALVISSGTNSSLAGNYRTATSAYYAGMAGLEEARGRLLWKNPDCLVTRLPGMNPNCPYPNFIPTAGVPPMPAMGLMEVRYIVNPAAGETVDPANLSPANPYADNEYATEFGFPVSSTNWQTTPSIQSTTGVPNPSYKWVRINVATENALGLDVNGDGVLDRITPLVFDPAPNMPCPRANPSPGLIVPNCPGWSSQSAVQALEITALAVAPYGGHRLLQYIVAPLIVSTATQQPPPGQPANADFPAALTLDGNGVAYTSPGTSSFMITGQDQCAGSNNLVYSVGYTDNLDGANIVREATPAQNYQGYPPGTGGPPPPPSKAPATIMNVYPTPPTSLIRPSWMQPATLDSAMQDIVSSADVVITGPTTGATIMSRAPLMSAANPMTIVVNGDLNLNGRNTLGYGLLLVTGTLTYDPDASWDGIVLVVGQGVFTSNQTGTGGFTGAVFVAKTRDSAGNLLGSLGRASFTSTGNHPGFGITYNSCWVNSAKGPLSYKILSFREVPLPN
jgi:hypothetical protein